MKKVMKYNMVRRKMTAFALGLVVLLTGCSAQTAQNTSTEGTVVWLVPVSGAKEAWETELNQILSEKGATYQVEIQEYWDGDEYDTVVDSAAEWKDSGEAADVISVHPTSVVSSSDDETEHVNHPFQEMVAQSLLEPLDEYLETEQARALDDVILPDEWEWGKLDNVTYKISQYVPSYQATAYNKELLEKYSIDPSLLSADPLENKEIFASIQNSEDVIPYLTNAVYGLNQGWWGSVGECDLLAYLTDGTLANVLETDEFYSYLSQIQQFRSENLIRFYEEGASGTFFATSCYATTVETYEDTMTVYENGGSTDIEVIVVPAEDVPALGFPGGDAGTGLASWSQNKDEAFDFLVRLYSDADIATLGCSDATIDPTYYYTNAMIARTEDGSDSREQTEQCYEDFEQYFPAGFRFDVSAVEEQRNAVDALLTINASTPHEITDLLYGDCEDLDSALTAAQKLVNDAGMSDILEEAKRQLEEFDSQ